MVAWSCLSHALTLRGSPRNEHSHSKQNQEAQKAELDQDGPGKETHRHNNLRYRPRRQVHLHDVATLRVHLEPDGDYGLFSNCRSE